LLLGPNAEVVVAVIVVMLVALIFAAVCHYRPCPALVITCSCHLSFFTIAAALVCTCCPLVDATLIDSHAMEEEDQLKRIKKLLLKILPFSYVIALEGGVGIICSGSDVSALRTCALPYTGIF